MKNSKQVHTVLLSRSWTVSSLTPHFLAGYLLVSLPSFSTLHWPDKRGFFQPDCLRRPGHHSTANKDNVISTYGEVDCMNGENTYEGLCSVVCFKIALFQFAWVIEAVSSKTVWHMHPSFSNLQRLLADDYLAQSSVVRYLKPNLSDDSNIIWEKAVTTATNIAPKKLWKISWLFTCMNWKTRYTHL